MPADHRAQKTEAQALSLSMYAYLFMAALGVGFAFITYSEAVLLDGIFSGVAFLMAILVRRVAVLVELPGSDTFHFGYAHFEPLLNTVRGLLILVLCALALFSAISALMHGGRELAAGWAVVYAGVAAAGCIFMAINQRRLSKKVASPLLKVDARDWMVDGVLSLAVGAAFLAAFLMEGTAWGQAALPYVDPALVCVLVLVMIRMPIKTLRENLGQVLQVAPEPEVQKEVQARFDQAVADLPTRATYVRMVQVGRFFYILAHLVVRPDFQRPMAELDDMRCQVVNALKPLYPRTVVDAVFTSEEAWATGQGEQDCQEVSGRDPSA